MARLPAVVLVLGGAALVSAASCGGDSGATRFRVLRGAAGRVANAPGGESGAGGAAGSVDVGRAGAGAKSGGGNTTASGGSAGGRGHAGRGGTTASAGGTGATSGVSGSGGKLAAGGGGTSGDAGGGEGGAPEKPALCVRLGSSVSVLLQKVAEGFENAFCADCNVNWVYSLCFYDPNANPTLVERKRIEFLNQITSFSFALWGCSGSEPPTTFALLDDPVPLSLADANALIDEYVAVTAKDLTMSADEIATLRAELVPLSESVLISPDPGGFSRPNCSVNSGGGEGGQGGAGGGQAGRANGGEPGSGQAGTGHAGAG